jgi:hypothetical protein
MERWSDEWAARRDFCNHYKSLDNSMGEYFCQGYGRPRPIPNFEKTLGVMSGLVHWMTPPPYGDPLRHIACEGTPPPKLQFKSATWPPDMTGPHAETTEVRDQLTTLLTRLARHVRLLSADVEPHRVFRRLFRLSHAAMAGSSSMA